MTKNAFQVFPAFKPEDESWPAWTARLESHLELQKCTEDTEKVCAIIAYMGHIAFKRLHDKLHPEKKPKELSYDEIVSTLTSIFEPQKNIFPSRIAFRKITQNSGEELNDFEARLRKGCTDCSWKGVELQYNLIEQFVVGLEDKTLKQSVLMKSAKLRKLEEVIDFARTIQMAKATIAAAAASSSASNVNFVRDRSRFQKKSHKGQPGASKAKTPACYRCGDKTHLAPNCQYQTVKCSGCGKIGHLQKVCRAAKGQHFLEDVPFHFVQKDDPVYVMVDMEGKSQKMEVDSGSGISAMSLSKFKQSPNVELLENDIKLRSATGDVFAPHSFAEVKVIHGQVKNLRIYLIANETFPTLLGRRWLKELDIDLNHLFRNGVHQIKVSNSSQNYKDRASLLLKKFKNLTKGGIGCI